MGRSTSHLCTVWALVQEEGDRQRLLVMIAAPVRRSRWTVASLLRECSPWGPGTTIYKVIPDGNLFLASWAFAGVAFYKENLWSSTTEDLKTIVACDLDHLLLGAQYLVQLEMGDCVGVESRCKVTIKGLRVRGHRWILNITKKCAFVQCSVKVEDHLACFQRDKPAVVAHAPSPSIWEADAGKLP